MEDMQGKEDRGWGKSAGRMWWGRYTEGYIPRPRDATCEVKVAQMVKYDIRNVNDQEVCSCTTPRGTTHISGNHDGRSARLELSKNPISLLLLLVSVNGKRGPSILSEVLGDVVGDSLGGGEDDDLGVLVRDGVKVLDELASLLEVSADLDDLGDVVVGGELHGSNVDLDGVLEEIGSESLNLLGPGGREEKGLSVGSDLGDNLPDLRLETHVKHSVL